MRSQMIDRLRRPEGVLIWGTLIFVAIFYFTPSSVLESIDYVLFYRPNIQFLRDALFELRLPLWNPYVGLGRPFLADVQTAVFYPPTYLLVFAGAAGLFIFMWLHVLLAAGGMFALSRALGVGSVLSCLMAFAFPAFPGLTARFFSGQIFYAAGLCYVPLLFLLAMRLGDEWNWRLAAGFSLALAGQFLCGHPQVFWCSVIALGVFILCRTPHIRNVGRFLIVCLWCAGLVAVVLLPFCELIGQGNRAANSRELASFGALRWRDFAILVTDPGYKVNWEQNFFIGLPAAVLGLAGLTLVRERNIRALWAVVLISALITVGPHSPLFNLFSEWLPGYGALRMHSRMAFMIGFALLVAGGMWLSKMQPRLLTLAQTNFNFPKPLLFVSLALLLVAPMCLEDVRIKRHSLSRIMGISPDFPFQWKVVEALQRENLLKPGQPPPLISVDQMLFPANFAMVHRLATFDAYTSLFLKRPWDYLHKALKLSDPGVFNTTLSTQVYARAFPYPALPIVLGFDPDQQRLVTSPEIPPRVFLWPTNAGTVKLTGYDCNSITLEVTSESPAQLVLTEAWYPGWRAKIGSATQAAFPANDWMRAAHVPAGKHQVELYFKQNHIALGAGISALSLGLCGLAYFPFSRARFCRGAGTGRSSAQKTAFTSIARKAGWSKSLGWPSEV